MKTGAETFHRVGETALAACAVLLPLAFFFRTYDTATIKMAVMHWAAIALALGFVGSALARGRFAVTSSSWPALLPALLYGGWAALSFALSPYKVAGLPLAVNTAAMLAAYLACVTLFAGARFSARLAGFTVLAGWGVTLYALLQAAGLDSLVWHDAFGKGVAFSTLANPEFCAAFLALMPPLALTLAEDEESPAALRYAGFALPAFAAAAAVLTRSGAGVLSFSLVCAVYGVLAPLAGGRRLLRAGTLSLGLAVLSVAAGAFTGALSNGTFRGDLRTQRYTAAGALKLAAKRPLLGVGPGAFGVEYPAVRPVEQIPLQVTHNVMNDRPGSAFLGALAETGVVGGFLYLWMFLGALWAGLSGAAALRRAGAMSESLYAAGFSAAAAGALLSAQFCEAWTYAAPGWFLWALAGLGAGLSALAAKRAPVSAYPFPVSEDVRRALYVPSLIAAAFLAVPPAVWLRSDVELNTAIFLAKDHDLDGAVAHFERVRPGAAGYLMSRYFAGNALLQQDRPEQALAYYDALSRLAPDYVLLHAKRGEALAKLDRLEEAVAERRRQAELDPLYVENLVAWAENARVLGDLEQAREAVALAKTAAPENADVRLQDKANELFERKALAGGSRRGGGATARRPTPRAKQN